MIAGVDATVVLGRHRFYIPNHIHSFLPDSVISLLRDMARWPDRRVYGLLLLLGIPAFLVFLGRVPFIGDEGIRAMVALEMKSSGNYLVPTLNGSWYGNKPPLYNWILLGTYHIMGYFGEIPSRLTTLFFLALYSWSVWRISRRYFDELTAVTLAIMLPTCGRILFWDSMVGLIDICFSWVMWLNFMVLYIYGKKGAWKQMFVYSYLLAAAGYFLKGFPPAVFQALSIPTALWLHGALKRQFISVAHLLGIAAGAVLLIAYYAAYATQVSLTRAFEMLLEQSLMRTATHYPWQETVKHLFAFPFEQVYHFLPWSLLLLFCFHPRFWQLIRQNDFVKFNFWILIVNLPVYWSSVEVYPRYLLMFVPLFNTIFLYAAQQTEALSDRWAKGIKIVAFSLSMVAALSFWIAPPLIERAHQLPWFWASWIGSGLLLTFAAAGVWFDKRRRMLWVACSVLGVRLAFDLMILPFRAEDDKTSQTRSDAQRLAKQYGDYDWYLYDRSEPHMVANFYLTNAADTIVPRAQSAPGSRALFFVDRKVYPELRGQVLDSLRIETGGYLHLMKITPAPDTLSR